jgi:NitT/TauT family transport system substrate-binding protein
MVHTIDRRRFMAISAGGALVATLPVPAAFGQAKHGKIDYGIASIEVNYLNTQSGPRSKQLLAAGQIFMATSGVNDAVAVSIAGKQATVVFGFDQRVPFANIMIRKADYESGRIRSVKDLAGKSIAVTQPQAATWLMAVYIADKAGIMKDVNVRGLGDFATMLGALKSGQVDATISTISMIDSATQQGWGHTLFDVTDEKNWNDTFGGSVPGVGCYVLADTIKEKGGAIQAFVSAMSKAQEILNASTPEQIADIVFDGYLTGYERPATLRALSVYKSGVWGKDNQITADSYNRLLKIMEGRQFTSAELAAVPYEKMIDMSFLAKARNS